MTMVAGQQRLLNHSLTVVALLLRQHLIGECRAKKIPAVGNCGDVLKQGGGLNNRFVAVHF
jgi:hypothetical protein